MSDRRPILILPYDPAWAALAAAESARIIQACPHLPEIEHIGSTAVPGLAAKPVIDLMPVLDCFEDGRACIEPMQGLGYEYRGEYGIPGRHFFVQGEPRTHNVHMLVRGSREHANHLLFRDYLRTHPAVAAEYATLKQELAGRFGDDIFGYTDAKADFILGILLRASAAAA